ncbi:MAG: amidohydrolase family protein [Thermodesulfobacteriota bacterium]
MTAPASAHDFKSLPKPDFRVPPLACDSHFHVFGPAKKYPYGTDLRYAPPLAPLDDYLKLARQLDMKRFVFVQPSAYGKDNSCMLDAMKVMGGRCRGVADIDEGTPDRELQKLHDLGVRAFRINTSPIKPYEAGYAASLIGPIKRQAERAKDLGWHLQFLSPGWLVEELMPTLKKLRVNFVIDHMGLFPPGKGIEQPGFQDLLNLLREGRCWAKFTAVYRISKDMPKFRDVVPFAQALIAAAPDRIIWGSDYPHLSFHDKVDSLELFNLLKVWAPDETNRRKILVDNPQALFGFDES